MTQNFVERLKVEWFLRFDQILEASKTIPSSNLKCLDLCQARCCPRVGMRQMQTSEIASPVVVLLPFELEYLVENIGVSRSIFRRWPLDLTPDVTIEIGMLDISKPCPFLNENLQCNIHENNPLDCRTFPLLPFQNLSSNLDWQLSENCPALALLSPNFTEAVKHVWQDIYPFIPQGWWDLYAFADHWTGWTPEANHAD